MVIIVGNGGISKALQYEFSNHKVFSIRNDESLKKFEAEIRKINKNNKIKGVIVTSGFLDKKLVKNESFINIDTTIRANLVLPIKIATVLYDILEENKGFFVVFSSSVVFGTREGYAVYSAAKMGLEKFIQNLNSESSIRCVLVRNGRTDTPLRWKNYEKNEQNKKNLLKPQEVAKALKDFLQLDNGKVELNIFKENEHLNIFSER